MKRTLALVLALVLCYALIPSAAFAAEPLKTVTITKTSIKSPGVYNAGGLAFVYTEAMGTDWNGEPALYIDSRGYMDASGKMVVPMTRNDDSPIRVPKYVNGVIVDGTLQLDLSTDYSESMAIYDKSGKKVGDVTEYVKEYAVKTFGSDADSYVSDVDALGDALMVDCGMSSESSGLEGMYTLALNAATGEVYYCQELFDVEDWGSAYGRRYSITGYSDGLMLYRETNYQPEYGEEVKTEAFGYINTSGKMVLDIKGKYDVASHFMNGVARVIKNDAYGAIDTKGKELIPCKFEGLGSFVDGNTAMALLNGKVGYVDKSGNTVIPFQYDDAFGSNEGVFTVSKNGKWGAVDKNNTIIVPMEYDDISEASEGVMYGIKDGFVYVIKYEDAAASEPADKPQSASERFTDVPANAWYLSFLENAYANGIVGGMSADKFGPSSNLSHGQIIVMVANLHNLQKGGTDDIAKFAVPGGHWCSAFLEYCKAEGILDNRYDDKLNSMVTRGEMAYYFAGAISEDSYVKKQEKDFSDTADALYAKEIRKLAEADIVGGFSDGSFKPSNLVTRAESVVFVSNLIKAMGK